MLKIGIIETADLLFLLRVPRPEAGDKREKRRRDRRQRLQVGAVLGEVGAGEYLKQQNPNIKVVALEPEDSPVLSEGRAGAHKIQGIGAGFVPKVLNTEIYDEVFKAPAKDAFETAKLLARKEGISVGISSGAALFGAITLAKKSENKGKVIVAILPDSGDRYYSTPLFTE